MKPPRSLGEATGPFDLSTHPIPATITLLESDFAGWLDPDRLRFNDEGKFVVNPDLRVLFNHEVGDEYNEPGSFEKVRAIYTRRLENFRRVLKRHRRSVSSCTLSGPRLRSGRRSVTYGAYCVRATRAPII
jgi:hypothetical protein